MGRTPSSGLRSTICVYSNSNNYVDPLQLHRCRKFTQHLGTVGSKRTCVDDFDRPDGRCVSLCDRLSLSLTKPKIRMHGQPKLPFTMGHGPSLLSCIHTAFSSAYFLCFAQLLGRSSLQLSRPWNVVYARSVASHGHRILSFSLCWISPASRM